MGTRLPTPVAPARGIPRAWILALARFGVLACGFLSVATTARAQAPVLTTIDPPGGAAGQTVTITLGGAHLQGVRTLRCSVQGTQCERVDATHFRLTIPGETLPGFYDVWAVGDQGVSGARSFVVSQRREVVEAEPNDAVPVPVGSDVVINGRIERPGDIDQYTFNARRGERVIIECLAERIDSRLRGVLEVVDSAGRRLAINRGHERVDPQIDFRVPADGTYVVRLHDLINSGGAEHYYRLEIDTGPRVAFSVPAVVPRGQASRVTVFGWNLPGSVHTEGALDRLDVDIPAEQAVPVWPLPIRMRPVDVLADGFPYLVPHAARPIVIGTTECPVTTDRDDNHAPASAQEIPVPCEVSGRLVDAGETEWYALNLRRGEALQIEAFGQRIHSPVDLQLTVHNASGEQLLARYTDQSRSIGGAVRTDHLDPSGRWVAPADGRYLVAVQNVTGGIDSDLRRQYRLGVRREEPDFQLIAAPHSDPAGGLNLLAGGRSTLDLILVRRRGFEGSVRVVARDLPAGVECPDVWFGPGVNRTVAVLTADRNAAGTVAELMLEGVAAPEAVEDAAAPSMVRPVRGATLVRAATPNPGGRLTSQLPLAVIGDAPLRVLANAHEPIDHTLYGRLNVRHSPGGIVDVAVQIDRRDIDHRAPVKLIPIGLPEAIRPQAVTLAPEQTKGYLSLLLPASLPVGRYSFALRAETTVPGADKKPAPVVVESNAVTLDIQPAAFVVEVDPFVMPRVRRGETLQVKYSARRINGFIGKMHTELASPGHVTNVVGFRGRGETFTGQTETGTLQIVVNDDAPLGPSLFLRLLTVGVVEDEPIYMGCSILPLEVIE